MGGKSAKAPDYTKAAEATGQSSKEVTNMQTYANRPDQITPFGNQTWTPSSVRDPATGQMVTKWSQTTTLDPEMQRSLDAQQRLTTGRSEIAGDMLGRVASEFGATPDFSRVHGKGGDIAGGPLASAIGGSAQYQGQAGDALMRQFSERQEPAFAQQQAQLETQLRNRGVKPGDEAYDQALAQLRTTQGDQRNQAMYQAQQMSAQEAARLQGMDVAAGGFQNQAQAQQFGQEMAGSQYANQQRQQDIAEMLQQRGWSLNEVNALITGQQVGMPSMPGFQGATKSDAVNYSGAAQQQYNAAQDAANAKNAMFGQVLGAASGAFPI